MRRGSLYVGIVLVSAATLMLELVLTRLFAVAEWYHFAFLSVSVALFGYASSGTLLTLLPEEGRARLAPIFGLAFPLSILAAYLIINRVPFDSYQLAWDSRQIVYLLIYYLSLVVPFTLSGLIVSYELALRPQDSHRLYAANLCGSALGSLSLLAVLPTLGGEGSVIVIAAVGALGGSLANTGRQSRLSPGLGLGMALACLPLILLRPTWMSLRISPYKSLSYALQTPAARLAYQQWNVAARLDVVESQQMHSAPGLSLQYQGRLPLQYGLTLDGDNLSPISRLSDDEDRAFLAYLPSSIPYTLRPQASALLLQPRGGMDVAAALHMGARQVAVVEDNAQIIHAVRDLYGSFTGGLYRDSRVVIRVEDSRSALQRGSERFDIIQVCLSDTYHPVGFGSYSLSENYLYTVEAFTQAMRRLSPRGLLVVSRWLQEPPSEPMRATALVVAALERTGIRQPGEHLLAFRSWSTLTLLASSAPFASTEIAAFRLRCTGLGYDLVYYPGISPDEANRFNMLPEDAYYTFVQEILSAPDRKAYYRTPWHDVTPPTDDHPFFGHYFRWRQIPTIVAQLGKTWQPFGGSGFLLILALLLLSVLAATILVWLPLGRVHQGPRWGDSLPLGRTLFYFAALGLGYLFVEMPLMQQFILYVGQPALAFILVLSALMLSSGIGSTLAERVNLRVALPGLVAGVAVYPWLLRALFGHTLALPLMTRMTIAVVSLLPLGFLMGIPFAGGMRSVERRVPGIIPWLWAINGSASVVSSILATVLALSTGYHWVLALAALCYLGAAWAGWPFGAKHS